MVSEPCELSYGISNIRVYAERYIEPLLPISDSYLSSFELVTDFPSGISLNPKTGVISGRPDEVEKQKRYQIDIVGMNHFGKVNTSFILTVLPDRSSAEGIFVCSTPIPPNYLSIIPQLFQTSSHLTCWEQPSFSWTSEHTSLNLHFTTHVNSPYPFPHAFILKTMVASVLYLDGYKTPLLQTDPSSHVVVYKVTIKLSAGLHRLELFANSANAEGKGYFALFHALTSDPTPVLLTYEDTVLPLNLPYFVSFPAVTGFEGVPLDIPLQTNWPIKALIRGEDPSIPASLTSSSPTSLRDVSPVCGEYKAFAIVMTEYGDRMVDVEYRVEPLRDGVLVVVYEESEESEDAVLKMQVDWMEDFLSS